VQRFEFWFSKYTSKDAARPGVNFSQLVSAERLWKITGGITLTTSLGYCETSALADAGVIKGSEPESCIWPSGFTMGMPK